jgi:tRNA A37 threonylcarbamoyladenosine synthetase subunit TsaC/SUA5/YrdC
VGSSIVDCTGSRPKLLRAGDLDVARLLEVEEIDTDGV